MLHPEKILSKAVTESRVFLILEKPLKVLKPHHIQQIDDALFKLGPFSEVRLIKNKGKLRFIQTVESADFVDGKE